MTVREHVKPPSRTHVGAQPELSVPLLHRLAAAPYGPKDGPIALRIIGLKRVEVAV